MNAPKIFVLFLDRGIFFITSFAFLLYKQIIYFLLVGRKLQVGGIYIRNYLNSSQTPALINDLYRICVDKHQIFEASNTTAINEKRRENNRLTDKVFRFSQKNKSCST